MRSRSKKYKNRFGASAVEFAVVAPVFFLTVFTCLEFSRFWMSETYVESAVFQTARDLSVFGATVEEGRPFAANVLGTIGIQEFDIEISPFDGEVPQTEINDSTTRITVTSSVPASEISLVNSILSDVNIVRTGEFNTNRP